MAGQLHTNVEHCHPRLKLGNTYRDLKDLEGRDMRGKFAHGSSPRGSNSRVKRLLPFFRNSEINKVTENSRWELIQNYHGWVLRPRNPDDRSRGQSVQRFNAGHLSARGVPRHRARDGLEGKRDGRKLRSPSGDRIVHGLEQQPCGVQVVARSSLTDHLEAGFRN